MIAEKKPSILVETALGVYLSEHVARKVAARKATEIFAAYIGAFMGKRPVADIRDCDIHEYMEARRAGRVVINPRRPKPRPAGDGTLRRELTVLRAALRYCHKRRFRSGARMIPADEMPEIPFPESPPPRTRWLTRDEEAALLSSAEKTSAGSCLSRIHRFVVVALETAARRSAIETLRWDQIDRERGTIDLNPRGRRQTKKRRAIVPISPALMKVVDRAWMERSQDEWFLDAPMDVTYDFGKVVRDAGLADVTPHVLRHTWATRAARAGVPMIQIAGMLGDSIVTVERNYYHHSPDYMRAAVSWKDKETV